MKTTHLSLLQLLLFALCISVPDLARSQDGKQNNAAQTSHATESVAQQIRGREAAWHKALLQASNELEQIYSPKLTYLDWNGTAHDRATLIADVQTGKLKYTAIKATKEEVKVFLHTAIYTCTLAIEGNYNDTSITRVARLLHVWVKEDGIWRLVVHQTQKLPS